MPLPDKEARLMLFVQIDILVVYSSMSLMYNTEVLEVEVGIKASTSRPNLLDRVDRISLHTAQVPCLSQLTTSLSLLQPSW